MEETKKAIAYVRVSTEEQSEKYGIEVQRDAIKKYADEYGYEIIDWVEEVASGADNERPGINSLLMQIASKTKEMELDAVITFKGDRIARDTTFFFYFWFILERNGVQFISVMDLDVDPSLAKLYMSILQYVAERERENIRIRTMNGRQAKAKTGHWVGGRPPLGYDAINGELVINEAQADLVKKLFSLRRQGMSLYTISDLIYDLGYRTNKGKRIMPTTLQYIFKQENFYRGFYKYGNMEKWIKGTHQNILPRISLREANRKDANIEGE